MTTTLPITTTTPITIPEDEAAELPVVLSLTQDDLSLDNNNNNNEELRRRRERKRRIKQWSDGVLLMAHPPMELEEFDSVKQFQPRPLRRSIETSKSIRIVDFGIPTNRDVNARIKEEHGEQSWRYQAMKVLHSTKVQYFLIVLLILDVLILFTEVTLMALFPFCDIIVRDAISCAPFEESNHSSTNTADDTHSTRWLAGYNNDDDICPSKNGINFTPQPDYPVGCDDHKWQTVHQVELALFIITIMILSFFFVELNVLMIVLKPTVFFRQFFYLLDYIIIGVSLGLELFFFFAHEELTSSLVGLLVIFRSWRYVRISHGIMEVTAELADQKFNRLLNYTEHLEQIIRQQQLDLPHDEKVDKLRQQKEPELVAQVRRHHAEEKRLKNTQQSANVMGGGGGGSDETTTANGSS